MRDEQVEPTNFSYKPESELMGLDQAESQDTSSYEAISWTASEFVANDKKVVWYLSLSGVTVLVCVAVYFISRDILSVIFIGIMAILFAIVASRKPRQLNYRIDEEGILVDQKIYRFSEFKSFSVQQNGVIVYVNLLPLHRFHNELSIFLPPENTEEVLRILSSYMPNDQKKETFVDKMAQLVRF